MAQAYKRKSKVIGRSCIESFRTAKVHAQLRELPIEKFYSAAASYSGPIALLYRKYQTQQLKLPENYDTHVLLFNCHGQLQRTVPFELKERVILFEFTADEQLLVLLATGKYYLIDAATSVVVEGNYFAGEGEQGKSSPSIRCVGAQLVDEKVVILRDRTIGVVQGVNGSWKGLPVIKLNSDNQLFSVSQTAEGSLQIVYLSREGTIDCFDLQKWYNNGNAQETVVAANWLKPKQTNYQNLISICYRDSVVAMVFPKFALIGKAAPYTMVKFQSFAVDKEDSLSKSNSRTRYRNFYRLGFLQGACFFYDRRRLLFFAQTDTAYDLQVRELSFSANLLSVGQSCLRLIQQYTFLYRCINNPIYYSITEDLDAAQLCFQMVDNTEKELFEHYDRLAHIYDCFIQRRPIELTEVHAVREHVQKVWLSLLDVVGLYVDPGEQLCVLRFANFLQNYFGIREETNRVSQISKQLRVVNGLRHEYMRRWLTHGQFSRLKGSNDRFLLLLLRYNMHFAADMVFEDSRSKERVFLHWARCKIEKESEEGALQQIKAHYQLMKVGMGNTYVFTDLAKYCLDRSMTGLALKLIELEPHVGRRCMVFLLIFMARKEPQTVDKLLEYSQLSGESATIHHTLQTLRKATGEWLSGESWLALLPKKPLLQSHYIRILRTEGQEQQLQRYLTVNKLYTDLGYLSLGRQLNTHAEITLKEVSELVVKDYSKLLPSLAEELPRCVVRKGMQKLQELRDKKYPITEEDGKQLTRDGELECLADLIMNKDGNTPLATRMLRSIKSEKVYTILLRRGKVREAIEQAFSRKNRDKLAELIPFADEETQEYAKKMEVELMSRR